MNKKDIDILNLENRIKMIENELNCKNLENRIKTLESELKHLKSAIQFHIKNKNKNFKD